MNPSKRTPSLTALALAAASAVAGCGGNAAGGSTTGGASTTGSGGSTGSSIAPLTDCMDDDIMDGFSGPGYDASKGGLQPPLQASYVAATTVLLQSSNPKKQALFGQLVPPILQDVEKSPGLVGMQIAVSSKCHYARTLTVWTDMESMMTFVGSPNHTKAVENAGDTSTAGAVTNWEIAPADMPPTWAVARQKILEMGELAY